MFVQLLIAVNKKEAYQEYTSRVIYQCIFVHILFENVVLVVKMLHYMFYKEWQAVKIAYLYYT